MSVCFSVLHLLAWQPGNLARAWTESWRGPDKSILGPDPMDARSCSIQSFHAWLQITTASGRVHLVAKDAKLQAELCSTEPPCAGTT
ncbi:hypothetical protein QBC39DRAFT_184280 [Podospora conica]|nr:hypothetical protein QBC39DRAFT_184280 [Schizothecium conicum]